MVLKEMLNNFENKNTEILLKKLNSSLEGLKQQEVEDRLDEYGFNELESEKKPTIIKRIYENI